MVPMTVVFGPGSVPRDLPRPLPFRDVQEMEISVNGERLSLSVSAPSAPHGWHHPFLGVPICFTPRQPGAPATPSPTQQHHPDAHP